MLGNVFEWTDDQFVYDLESEDATDPWTSGDDGERVPRGGAFNDSV
jgi:formylglycine-generating enzyme required for sulfatase activity